MLKKCLDPPIPIPGGLLITISYHFFPIKKKYTFGFVARNFPEKK
jgi:hypothetical protein